MSSCTMNVINIKVSGIFSYAHYTPPKSLILSQEIFTIPLKEAGDAFINAEWPALAHADFPFFSPPNVRHLKGNINGSTHCDLEVLLSC